MNELTEILSDISTAGRKLGLYANREENYNNSLSSELEKMSWDLQHISQNINDIKEFFSLKDF